MNRPQLRWLPSLAVLGLLMLAACGGGDAPGGSRTQPPPSLAALTVTPAAPWKNGVVEFETECVGSGSLQYEWDFGDGTRRAGVEPRARFKYLEGGTRDVTVTCIDATQQRTSATLRVVVDDIDLNPVANRTCSSALPGHGWCVQSPLPTGVSLQGVAVIDRVTIWVVGDGGSIIKSDDGGATWHPQQSGVTDRLNSIAALSDRLAWAVGGAGTVIKTTDGGRTWRKLGIPTNGWLKHVAAVGLQTLWVAGTDEILKSIDGGNTWQRQYSSGGAWVSLSAASEQVAWAVSEGNVLRTVDGGSNWATLVSAPNLRWSSVAAVSAVVAWAVASTGEVYRTADGGLTWELKQAPDGRGFLASVSAVDADTAWVTGWFFDMSPTSPRRSLIMATHNAGLTWRRTTIDESGINLLAVAAESLSRAWAVGSRGEILEFANGGSSWKNHSSGTAAELSAVTAADADVAWVIERDVGGVLRTSDGGISWTRLPLVDTPGGLTPEGYLTAIDAVDRSTAWIVGRDGWVFNTTNGGVSWNNQVSGTTEHLHDVSAPTRSVVWAAGKRGTVLRTADGGAHWGAQAGAEADEEVVGVSASDASTAWIVANALGRTPGARRGRIRMTTDGGATWVTQLESNTYTFSKVSAIDARTAWVLGRDDTNTFLNGTRLLGIPVFTVFLTTDGANWRPVWTFSNTGTDTSAWQLFGSLNALDARHARVVGTRMYETRDGGETWQQQAADYGTGGLNSSFWVDADTAWAVGRHGLILKTLTGGR